VYKEPKNVKKNDWPYNLLEAVGIEHEDPLEHLSDEAELDLAMCMSRLTDREKFVIRERYFRQKTLEEIAPEIGTQRERVRQIEAKALRKLRHPYDASGYILLHGAKAYVEMRISEKVEAARQEIEAQLVADYHAKMQELEQKGIRLELEALDQKCQAYSTGLDELNLSVRAYNCLARSGCKNVSDIITKYPTWNDACKIRNLGRKSMEEISVKLKGLGVDWPGEVV